MNRFVTAILLASCAIMGATGAHAQKMGKGGLGIDNSPALPKCATPLGTIALVEKEAIDPYDKLPEGLKALAAMAEAQDQKDGPSRVDPIPLVRLMATSSGCFLVADRGEAFEAVKRERELSGLGELPVTPATHILNVELVYSDSNSRGTGGGIGSGAGTAIGIKSKNLEASVLLSVVDVKTGLQVAALMGSARKKDLSLVGGGILVDLGVGLLGGTYSSTNIGKVTSYAALDGFGKLVQAMAAAIVPPAATPMADPQ